MQNLRANREGGENGRARAAGYLPHAFLSEHPDPAPDLDKALEFAMYFAIGGLTGWLIEQQDRVRQQLERALDERNSLEAQLVRAGQLSALGELTTGLAHEIRTVRRRDDGVAVLTGRGEMSRLLIVEDDDSLREVLTSNLRDAGYDVTAAAEGLRALQAFEPDCIDVVITDLRMPGMGGLELLDQLLERDPSATVLVLTAYGSTDHAIEAMRRGAFHYVEKPANLTTLRMMVERAIDVRKLRVSSRATTTIISAALR